MSQPKINLMLDSGAWSAYSKKESIDIDQLSKFCLDNQAHIQTVVNLDVLNYKNPEEAARKSFENFLYLKNKGLSIMPVFHIHERFEWAEKYLDNTDYLGLSASMASVREGIKWYESIFNRLTDASGNPVAKFHGFGDTAYPSLTTFPWHTTDSSTWMTASGLGARTVINGKFVAFRANKAWARGYVAASDTGEKKRAWEEGLTSIGLDPDKCMNLECRPADLMLLRIYINAAYFLTLGSKCPRTYKRRVNLTETSELAREGIILQQPLRIFFVFSNATAVRALAVLGALKAKDLLISYYYVNEKQWDQMIIPFLYEPEYTCQKNEKIREQMDILQKFMLPQKVSV